MSRNGIQNQCCVKEMDLQRIKMQKTCNLISSEVKDFQPLSKVFSKWRMSLLTKRNIFKRIFVGFSVLCSVQRSSSSQLEMQHDSLIVAASSEEFNGESSSSRVICMDYIAWLQPFLNSSERHSFKLTWYRLCTEPNENMKRRAEPALAWSGWNRTGFAHHQ